MRILVLGGDGYLGWPTALHLSQRGHEVAVLDNFSRRLWDYELGAESLTPIETLQQRIAVWRQLTGKIITPFIGDLCDYTFLEPVIRDFQPEAVVHFGEQRSAPYSMIDRQHAVFTHVNNVVGTLNVLYAIADHAPDCHLVKLGTMGEYGTRTSISKRGISPLRIRDALIRSRIRNNPAAGTMPQKCMIAPTSCSRAASGGLRATDLNQGVVYGVETPETTLDPRLATRFDYDGVFGTALNRFLVQAVVGLPLTVYGKGGQTRGFLDIRDTLACVELAIFNPAARGELRVFNQFTEQFNVAGLAEAVREAAQEFGFDVTINHLPNPRVEKEEHYYNAANTRLLDLGLKPHYLSETLLESVMRVVMQHRDRVRPELIMPAVNWRRTHNPLIPTEEVVTGQASVTES
jgi:UDP-sulfoquinovose synthase